MTKTRDEMMLDLPFHANGTLSEAERAEIDAWLAEDALARAEAADLAAMRDEMQAEEVRSPGEFGLVRLMRDVGREQAAPVATPVASRPWIWQAVAAVAMVGLIGQALLPGAPGPGAAPEVVASAPADLGPADLPPDDLAAAPPPAFEMAGVGPDGPTLTVAFAPDATEAALRDLLLAEGIEIVAGPSALGLYQLRADDLGAAQAALAASPLVASVEAAAN
jgi:hypothetical protein